MNAIKSARSSKFNPRLGKKSRLIILVFGLICISQSIATAATFNIYGYVILRQQPVNTVLGVDLLMVTTGLLILSTFMLEAVGLGLRGVYVWPGFYPITKAQKKRTRALMALVLLNLTGILLVTAKAALSEGWDKSSPYAHKLLMLVGLSLTMFMSLGIALIVCLEFTRLCLKAGLFFLGSHPFALHKINS